MVPKVKFAGRRRGRIQKANCFFLSGIGQKLRELLMKKKDEMLSDLIAYPMNISRVPPGVCVTRFKNLFALHGLYTV